MENKEQSKSIPYDFLKELSLKKTGAVLINSKIESSNPQPEIKEEKDEIKK